MVNTRNIIQKSFWFLSQPLAFFSTNLLKDENGIMDDEFQKSSVTAPCQCIRNVLACNALRQIKTQNLNVNE